MPGVRRIWGSSDHWPGQTIILWKGTELRGSWCAYSVPMVGQA